MEASPGLKEFKLDLKFQRSPRLYQSISKPPKGVPQIFLPEELIQGCKGLCAKLLHRLCQWFSRSPAISSGVSTLRKLPFLSSNNDSLLWGVIVEIKVHSQDAPACHGYRRRSPQNEILFGESGRFKVYVSYGIHYCFEQAMM